MLDEQIRYQCGYIVPLHSKTSLEYKFGGTCNEYHLYLVHDY